jgi:CO dehydrogenase/acetyl-CoA synthase delta subunit
VPDPRYFTKEEADAMKGLAKDKTEGARQSKRAYKSLAKIEAADKTVHKEHRKYEGAVAENELGKKRSDAGLAKKLHSMRPGYARLGLGIDKADSDARTRIDAIKAKLTGGSN